MILHEDLELLGELVTLTAEYFGVSELYVEKDYWVTLALSLIFKSERKDQCIFKGGTSLSKCYKIINRFSEDIDIALKNGGELSSGQVKRQIKGIKKLVSDCPLFFEDDTKAPVKKGNNFSKTFLGYNAEKDGAFGPVRKQIVLEIANLGGVEPSEKKNVCSLIYEALDRIVEKNDKEKIVEKYNLHPFFVNVMNPKRTLCEKIMSLVKFSRLKNPPYIDLRHKIRHAYDCHLLLERGGLGTFLESGEFEEILLNVGKDDYSNFTNSRSWIKNHPKSAIIFERPDATWKKIKNSYQKDFKKLIFGELPKEEMILGSIKRIGHRLKSISWEEIAQLK